MWIKNFVSNWVITLWKIYEAWKQTMEKENLNLLIFFWKALKDSSIWAYYVFLKWELDWIIKKNEIEFIKNETSEKVAYLIWWYYLNPATLLDLKKSLENKWISVKIINERYYSKETLSNVIKELKVRLKKDSWKDIVLFWYSAWWWIAHRIWEKSWHKSVSFWISENPNETMVWTLLSLTKKEKLWDVEIPKTWTNIIESFSWMVPFVWELWENTIQLSNTYSHMTIWREDVIEEITKQILWWFKND